MAYVRLNQCGYSSFCKSTIAPLSSYIELGSESHRMPLVQDIPNEGFEKPPFTTSYKAQLRPSVLVATLFLRSHFQTAQTKINKSTPFFHTGISSWRSRVVRKSQSHKSATKRYRPSGPFRLLNLHPPLPRPTKPHRHSPKRGYNPWKANVYTKDEVRKLHLCCG